MTGLQFIDLTTTIALVLLGIAFVLTLVRLVLGPTLADRILCLDTVAVFATGAIGIYAIRSGLFLYVDIAIAIGLVGFLSTAAFARFLLTHLPEEQQ